MCIENGPVSHLWINKWIRVGCDGSFFVSMFVCFVVIVPGSTIVSVITITNSSSCLYAILVYMDYGALVVVFLLWLFPCVVS